MKNYHHDILKKIQLFFFVLLIIFLPISESIKQICFVILLTLFFINRVIGKKIDVDFFSIGLFVYFIGSLLSIPFSSSYNLSFKWSYNIFMVFVLYLIMINEFKSGYCHNLIKKSFFISLLIGLSWGIFIWKLYLAKPRLEIHSIGAPNSTGTFLGISLIFLICHLLQKKYQILKSQILKNKELIFYFFILFLLIVAIILNGSRGMYIGLIASLSFLFIRFGKVNKNYLFLFFFVSLLLIIGILVYPELRVRILDPYSMYERFDNWYRNLQCFKINPITGAGDYNCYLDPDNLFITILSKTGIVGLISFFIMVYFYLKQFNYNKFIIAFLIFILTNGIFETTFKHEAAITFIIVSYITGYGKNSDS